MNRTIELLRRTRELLTDLQTELVTQALIEQAKARAEDCGLKPRKRTIKAKINGGEKCQS